MEINESDRTLTFSDELPRTLQEVYMDVKNMGEAFDCKGRSLDEFYDHCKANFRTPIEVSPIAKIDYKQLLKKYMKVIFTSEGSTYLSSEVLAYTESSLTQDEVKELVKISEELGLG